MFCAHTRLPISAIRWSGTGTLAATRTLATTTPKYTKTIRIGEPLPNAELFEKLPSNKLNIHELTSGKKVVMFAVPGAFAPNCSNQLPGYVKNADKFKQEGIDEIICLSVNDPYVMAAWGAQYDTNGKIRMLADPSGAFVKALGLETNLPLLGGLRAKRFSMIVNDNFVEQINVEPDGTGLTCTVADKLLKKKKDETIQH